MIKIWDVLFWVTVLFPLLTGGIWIREPGLKIELSQISIQLAILWIWGMVLMRRNTDSLLQASSIRFLSRLWTYWQSRLHRHPTRTLAISYIFFGSLWSWVALERHWAFSSGYADLGIFANAIWNLSHGNGYVSSVKEGMNLFADHQSPIFWALAPFYKAFPVPETLLVAQGFGLCSGAIALFLIGKQYLPAGSSYLAALPLLYWFFNPLRNANRFDFHPEVFLVPCFLFGIWGMQEIGWKKKALGALFLGLGLMGKESCGPVLAGIGFAWILGAAPGSAQKFCRVAGLFLIPIGAAHLYFCTKIVPGLFAYKYQYQHMFAHFGDGIGDLLLAPFRKPLLFFEHVFGPERLRFFAGTLLPVSFLPLLSPVAFVAAIPGYLIYFLSAGSHRLNLGYHYAIESSVGLLWALTVTFAKLENERFLPWLQRRWIPYILFLTVFVSYGRSEPYFIRFFQKSPHHAWLESEVFPLIPDDAKIATTGTFVPHLAARKWVHHLPEIDLPDGRYVDCVYWSRNSEANNSPMNPEIENRLEELMKKEGFLMTWTCDGLSVYQNPSHRGTCLTEIPRCNR